MFINQLLFSIPFHHILSSVSMVFVPLTLLRFCSQCLCVSLCVLGLYLCWTEGTQPVRHRPGIFLCPSSPTLSLRGAGTVGCGKSSAPRAATSPLLSSVRSDPTLLRKSVSFTEDLLLGASGTVGLLLCLWGEEKACWHPDHQKKITQHACWWCSKISLLLWPQHAVWRVWQLSSKLEYLYWKQI